MTVIGKIVWFLLLVCTDVLEVSEGRLAPEKVDLGPTKATGLWSHTFHCTIFLLKILSSSEPSDPVLIFPKCYCSISV